jgi:FkbM family methyltransferase
MLTEHDVIWAYRLCLDREPEGESVIQEWIKNANDRTSLTRELIFSDEYKARYGDLRSPFWHYHTSFDPVALIRGYSRRDLKPSPDHLTNFLGVKVPPQVYPPILSSRVGTVEPPPLPANWHADIAEWGSCLRAVDLSKERFVMLELGCGWGCWMNNLGVAARSKGKEFRLYGIEAAEEHLGLARQALSDNGISDSHFKLVNGIAGKSASIALFPKVQSGATNWGGTAIFDPSAEQLEGARRSGDFVSIPIVDIAGLLKDEKFVDLLHVDIQGAELDLLREVFDVLCEKVRCVVIGTHSKAIEAGLFDLFLADKRWGCEMERGALYAIKDGWPGLIVDGVQTWRNSRLPV